MKKKRKKEKSKKDFRRSYMCEGQICWSEYLKEVHHPIKTSAETDSSTFEPSR